MKKYLIILFLFLFGVSYSQDGIGKFKINKTRIEIIKEIEKEINVDCEITSEQEFNNDVYSKEFIFKEIFNDTSTRIFYISNYIISDIKLFSVYLIFEDDYLIEFKCDKNKDLDILLARKYGRPYVEQKLMPYNNSLLKYDESIIKLIWKKDDIRTISFEKTQMFDGFVRKAESYFKIYDRNHINILNKIKVIN